MSIPRSDPAVRSVRGLLNTGHMKIIEGDLAGYFDSLPHAGQLKSVARRVSDRHLLHLIKMWLVAPVEEDDGRGGKTRTTPGKDSGVGAAGGSPLSPLLGNLYMRRFVLGWKRRGVEDRLQGRIASYADDHVICCNGDVDKALAEMREMMRRLKLTVNEAKTRVCHLPEERFDFLGYSYGRYYSPQTGRAYLCPWPSKRSVQRLIGAIRGGDRTNHTVAGGRRDDTDGQLSARRSADILLEPWNQMLHVEGALSEELHHEFEDRGRISGNEDSVDAQEDVDHGECHALVAIHERVILNEAFEKRRGLVNNRVVVSGLRSMQG